MFATFSCFAVTGMSAPPSSKHAIASQTASAAEWAAKEACVQQAAVDWASGAYPSICKAAAFNDVAEATLHHCLADQVPKKDAQIGTQSLTPAAENALAKHIQHCACSGFPLTPSHICEYANTIT